MSQMENFRADVEFGTFQIQILVWAQNYFEFPEGKEKFFFTENTDFYRFYRSVNALDF